MAGPLKILFVEPHDATARALARLLNREGYVVFRAGNLAEARELCEVGTFDLVLAEFRLPDGDARALLAAGGPCHGTPGVVLSVYDDREDVERSRAAGFAAHLCKLTPWDELRATIARVAAGG